MSIQLLSGSPAAAARRLRKEGRMRRVRYGCAMSLDGFIAGPRGEFDWIVMDPEIDFAEMMRQYDTFLVGRKSYEAMQKQAGGPSAPGIRTVVFSRTLEAREHPDVTIVSRNAKQAVLDLKQQPGKDIALFGGGELFRSLLKLGVVDTVEVAVIPCLLGKGIPLVPSPAPRTTLELTGHRHYKKTGTVMLQYDIK
jgi:dihydrofolate reductase